MPAVMMTKVWPMLSTIRSADATSSAWMFAAAQEDRLQDAEHHDQRDQADR